MSKHAMRVWKLLLDHAEVFAFASGVVLAFALHEWFMIGQAITRADAVSDTGYAAFLFVTAWFLMTARSRRESEDVRLGAGGSTSRDGDQD